MCSIEGACLVLSSLPREVRGRAGGSGSATRGSRGAPISLSLGGSLSMLKKLGLDSRVPAGPGAWAGLPPPPPPPPRGFGLIQGSRGAGLPNRAPEEGLHVGLRKAAECPCVCPSGSPWEALSVAQAPTLPFLSPLQGMSPAANYCDKWHSKLWWSTGGALYPEGLNRAGGGALSAAGQNSEGGWESRPRKERRRLGSFTGGRHLGWLLGLSTLSGRISASQLCGES